MTFRLRNRRKKVPVMGSPDWEELGGFLSMFAMLVGLGAAFFIPRMEWAAVVGTAPAWGYLIACWFTDWSKQA